MTNALTHLHNLSMAELKELILSRGEPEYRYRQLARWMYARLATDIGDMTDLPLQLREELSARCRVSAAGVANVQVSQIDGTRKYLFELSGGGMVEAVLMQYEKRTTLCVSTQVGCPLDCTFCETAKGRFLRNLTAGEILDQICRLKSDAGPKATKVNVVFMGMGEPMLNYDSVVGTIRTLNHEMGLRLGAKRVTVSTSSFPGRIRDLADEDIQCSLALSLNAPNDGMRRELMPKASRCSIEELLEAAGYFARKKGRRVTLEYVMLSGVNTSPDHARQLGALTRGLPFKLNLIPYNPGRDAEFGRLSERELQAFVKVLLPLAPAVTVRRSRGTDIDAGCGQLWTSQGAGQHKA